MARVLIIGGHGKIARLLLPLLTERGDAVTAAIRNPEHAADIEAEGATPLVEIGRASCRERVLERV